MRCDVIANGIINAAENIGIQTPIVLRLQGTNYEEGKALIEGCGYNILLVDDLDDAATKAVGVAELAVSCATAHINENANIKAIPKFEGFSL